MYVHDVIGIILKKTELSLSNTIDAEIRMWELVCGQIREVPNPDPHRFRTAVLDKAGDVYG